MKTRNTEIKDRAIANHKAAVTKDEVIILEAMKASWEILDRHALENEIGLPVYATDTLNLVHQVTKMNELRDAILRVECLVASTNM